jgi:acetylglutamate kinase
MNQRINQTVNVVKIGGNIINDPIALNTVLDHFARLDGPRVLIHGGGKLATELAGKLGIPQTMVQGRRVTDQETLRIAVMVYGGLINKSIVAGLQARGVPAVGVSGADLDLIRAERRNPVPVDYGFVGDITGVNAQALTTLLHTGITPVFAPLSHDGKGSLLNTNADTIAYEVAKALAPEAPVRLLFTFEKEGVLLDVSDENTLVKDLTPVRYAVLREQGKITDGMIPKLENAFRAIEAGVSEVILGKAEALPRLIERSTGTRLFRDA